MNIFVTVGHTYYNSLFKAVNEQLSPEKYSVVNQISTGSYRPEKHSYFKFTENVEMEIEKADIVITHAGAGSVYHLLELGKPIVVVPNFERVDEHQKDLADFVSQNNYACVCRNLAELEQCVQLAHKGSFTPYLRDAFRGYELILDSIAPNETFKDKDIYSEAVKDVTEVTKLVTIYIPTHNRCELLKRAVTSVLKQDYPNIELIIVDDASCDETPEYLAQLVELHDNVRFFTQTSAKGACAARNIAIEAAHGELITGLDDDDEFLSERISHLVANYDESYAFTCTGFIWNYGKRSRKVDNTSKIISLSEQLNYNYATNQVLVSTERLKAINGFDEDFVACQDYDTWTRLIKTFGNAKRVAGANYVIHRGDDIERLTKPDNWLKGNNQYITKHKREMSDKNIENQIFRQITVRRQRYEFSNLIKHLSSGLVKDKIRYFVSSNFTFIGKIRRSFLEN